MNLQANCPHCGAAVTYDAGQGGMTVACPTCRGPYVLPAAQVGGAVPVRQPEKLVPPVRRSRVPEQVAGSKRRTRIFRLAVPGLLGSVVVLLVIWMMAEAVERRSRRERESLDANNLRAIATAIVVDSVSLRPYSTDPDGNPLLSWRVLILPNIGEADLYQEFHLHEPWDSEHNRRLIAKMPDVFRSPYRSEAAGMTTYLLATGPGTVFGDGRPLDALPIYDGASNTIMAISVGADRAVPWTKPEDLEVDLSAPFDGIGEPPLARRGRRGAFVACADGRVIPFDAGVAPDIAAAWFTSAGNEIVNQEEIHLKE